MLTFQRVSFCTCKSSKHRCGKPMVTAIGRLTPTRFSFSRLTFVVREVRPTASQFAQLQCAGAATGHSRGDNGSGIDDLVAARLLVVVGR